MPYFSNSIQYISNLLGQKTLLSDETSIIEVLAIDSRKIINPSQTLFFALKGQRNGHDFIPELIEKGVKNFVVSEEKWLKKVYDANFILVNDTLKAMQQLAADHRKQFTYPVIGITGSNGKTIVKEWLFQLLSVDHHIVRSPKSYNSQIGVPLSVWQLNDTADLAIFEAGISQPNEMDTLTAIIQPTIGVLTNIGAAHDEGFTNRAQKLEEKLKLFKDVGLFIFQKEDLKSFKKQLPGKQQFSWSLVDNSADLFVEKMERKTNSTKLTALINAKEFSIEIPFIDEASIKNVLSCWSVLLALELPFEQIKHRMKELAPIEMRLKLRNGINNCTVINDSYNSDLGSLEIAINFLKQQQQHPRKTLILSDIAQSGIPSTELYKKVAELLASAKIDHLIGIGPEIASQAGVFKLDKEFYADTASFLENFTNARFSNETILLKGARAFEFEQISKLIEQKVHETVFEINLNGLIQNLNYYKSKLEPDTKLMAMVKAFSYGSGSFEIASVLQYHKVDYLAVAYVDEGVELRKGGIKLPIMVMSPDVSAFEGMVKANLEPEIYNFRILNELISFLLTRNTKEYRIHLKIDTGMHRLGFLEENIDKLITILNENRHIRVASVFSHLAASEDAAEDGFTQKQLDTLLRVTQKLELGLGYSFIKHICNTAGISRHPEAHLDMVRLGLGLYGIDSAVKNNRQLQPIGTLKTTITQIKELEAGETVSYNRRGIITQHSRIATVKLGYADGYSRKLGYGNGEMLVNGHRVPVIGTVCMDMLMLDVTGVECKETDEVIVFNDELRVEELADKIGTIPYEVLTGISQRVKRIYVYE
ncbi:bifunctional UDP-N-acetylmuramoyl-tripeptide:D-alanyl-D-alanine ligase/alanine racemase [Solitalea lacus]|uniref:bifunctional UDP-N-acetylmuramoyl-tripeptide:D-alanyl-D-alanine ligase/alanine racemase n=1 Tax=Solitalea lacus TaxID=2911172 RepID=UPI001EDBA978|nr:bifunctional UDP-N-acetylmuramoyl-tripeptide:D-alanyl-D-alanine ligase/alanine racemase [Solitalea lacus]UKJ06133.1 bifunctional UDP-N-acetylmuramoyl-tripeptide:D-alanyl-D-alanine ligase/alanine racemase [Solitalea lacus]